MTDSFRSSTDKHSSLFYGSVDGKLKRFGDWTTSEAGHDDQRAPVPPVQPLAKVKKLFLVVTVAPILQAGLYYRFFRLQLMF
jgi:hypothetical protein